MCLFMVENDLFYILNFYNDFIDYSLQPAAEAFFYENSLEIVNQLKSKFSFCKTFSGGKLAEYSQNVVSSDEYQKMRKFYYELKESSINTCCRKPIRNDLYFIKEFSKTLQEFKSFEIRPKFFDDMIILNQNLESKWVLW